MKLSLLCCLLATVLIGSPLQLHAQTTNAAPLAPTAQDAMDSLMRQVQSKVDAGKRQEADYAEELKAFDVLIASQQATNADMAAQITYMKAVLYLQIFQDYIKSSDVFGLIKTNYPDTKYSRSAEKILAQIEGGAAAQKIQDALAIGSIFPDFSETDLDGKTLSVASRKGKVVLVDFWATWCVACRIELPSVIDTYKKYHDDGFEIIGVSLDSERDKVDAFLKAQTGMTWPEYYDGQGWTNKLAVKYGVQGIPFAVLIGPDGRIIGKKLHGEELEAAVTNALAKK